MSSLNRSDACTPDVELASRADTVPGVTLGRPMIFT
jgi:hypothetical protein